MSPAAKHAACIVSFFAAGVASSSPNDSLCLAIAFSFIFSTTKFFK